MAGSLKDQLIKAGLTTVDRARKVERQARAEQQARRQPDPAPASADSAPAEQRRGKAARHPPGGASAIAAVRARAAELNAEKAERDRVLQQAANDKAAAKAQRAELKQLIQQNDQRTKPNDNDVPYNFVHGRKIKRIYVTREHQAQLSNGSLVIVNNDGRYSLVSNAVAERIRARDPRWIVTAHEPTTPTPAAADPDAEYYARFQVPDDLDW